MSEGRGLAFVSSPALETARLRLRLPAERDLDALAAMYADGTTMRHIGEGKVLTRAETWRAIAGMLGHWALRGYGMWAVERRDSGEMIGRVGFIDPEGWPGFELGWLIARPHWSQGFATECARAALDYAGQALGRTRVISLIRPANAASIRVAEKLGFRLDGTVELLGAPALVYETLRRADLAVALLAALLALPPQALAGAQQQEVLSAAVRATLTRAVSERTNVNWADLDARAWVRAMTPKVQAFFGDEEAARQFLGLVRYESMRAGLDPHLVLAVIDVESHFRKYAVSKAGARGLMQVMPFWVKDVGEPSHNLFHEKTNLRYGCVILRHYLDRENGNISNALGRYNGSLGKPDYPNRVMKAYKSRWAMAA